MSDEATKLHGEWTAEQRAEAHAALDEVLDGSDVVLLFGAGGKHSHEHWFARERGPLLTTTFLGALQLVVMRAYQRVIDEEES